MDLLGALERDEYLLHYQARRDIKTGRIVAVEALIRWQHPELGMVPPNQFIPIAEHTSAMGLIQDWVLRTACTQNKAWQDRGLPPLRVSVNLSPSHLANRDFAEQIEAMLADIGLSPEHLGLELTESTMMRDIQSSIETMRELRASGVQIAVDDFGTGYSSLSYLRRLPIDAIHIGRPFLFDIATDPADAAVTHAIISMAHSLGLEVAAIGVETEGQLAFLRDSGCDMAQGYLFSKPLPSDQLSASLSK